MRELNDIHRGGDGDMGQMRFGQAKVARAPQAHRARPLRMRSFNACPMAIGVLEGLRALVGVQQKAPASALVAGIRQGPPSRTGTGGSTGTRFTIGLGELHFDDGLAFGILSRRPT